MEVRSIEAIVRTLNDHHVKYLVVGGLAVNAHGFVRMTRDIDLVLQLDRENALRGLQALLEIGYQVAIPARPEEFADAPTRERWRREKQMIVLKLWSDQHQRTPVNIFIYEPFDFAEEVKRSAAMEIAPGLVAPVVSLPALLQMKRAAARPHDLIDIKELERIQ